MPIKKIKRGGDLGNQLYDGAASFGRFIAIAWFIFLTIISIICFIVGLFFIFSKNKYSSETTGKIVGTQCPTSATFCNSVIEYTVNNNKYKISDTTSKGSFEGATVSIVYDPANPNNAKIKGANKLIVGCILLGVAIVIFGFGYLIYYVNTRYKFAAAASGVGTGIDILT